MGYREDIVELAQRKGWTRGAELGLNSCLLLELFLKDVPDLHIIGVDHFVRDDRKRRALAIASRFPGRSTILVMTTGQAAPLVPDGSLDFVFVDATHKFGCVRADLRAWWPKVRAGGWFGGADYDEDHPGVVQAVAEKFGLQVKATPSAIWSVVKE